MKPLTIFTPTRLNALASQLLESTFATVWLEAELSNIVRPASGHLYFTLKDAHAQIRAALFRSHSQRLKFIPREGMHVRTRGRLTVYGARGDYQLVLEHMEPAGVGALRLAFDALKARLEAEGLFDPARKRPLPTYPHRLAVITSASGAVIRDIHSVLARRFPLVDVELLPALVQGQTAAATLTSLLQQVDKSGRFDVILLARGGGSLEDLAAFNDEQLVRAIAASHTPVVSAIGHETDFSLSDFAADVRAPTPSVAAELLVPDHAELGQHLGHLQQRLTQRQQYVLQQAIQQVDRAYLRLQTHCPQAHLKRMHQRQQLAWQHLQGIWQQQQALRYARLHHCAALLNIRQQQQRLSALSQHVERLLQRVHAVISHYLDQQHLHLHGLARSLEAVSPLATVARGYALLSCPDKGTLIRSAHHVQPGQRVHARLAEGELWLRVETEHVRL